MVPNMTSSFSSTALSAMVSAVSHEPEGPLADAAAHLDPRVRAEIDHARVDLYCGRDTEAVANIRAAREHLRESAGLSHVQALTDLDEAAWFARLGRTAPAELALERALLHAGLVPATPSPQGSR